jgi:hypothetical protein
MDWLRVKEAKIFDFNDLFLFCFQLFDFAFCSSIALKELLEEESRLEESSKENTGSKIEVEVPETKQPLKLLRGSIDLGHVLQQKKMVSVNGVNQTRFMFLGTDK